LTASFDAIVVGAGPAGLTAGIYLGGPAGYRRAIIIQGFRTAFMEPISWIECGSKLRNLAQSFAAGRLRT